MLKLIKGYIMEEKILDFYKQTSQFTDLGKYKEDAIDLWENKCKKDLKTLCHYLMNVTIHRVVLQSIINGKELQEYGDASLGIPPRGREIP